MIPVVHVVAGKADLSLFHYPIPYSVYTVLSCPLLSLSLSLLSQPALRRRLHGF
jgi:hypothetical protein